MSKCKIDGCANDAAKYRHGVCFTHHSRMKKHGHYGIESTYGVRNFSERFAKSTARTGDGCLEWVGPRNNKGYGATKIRKKNWLVHRYVWTTVNGDIPVGGVIAHACDNPACCEISHLFLTTQAGNMADCTTKGRGPRGERNGHAKMTDEDVRALRLGLVRGIDLVRRLGVDSSTVSMAKTGRKWKHVETPPRKAWA